MHSILFFDPLCRKPYSTRTRYEVAMAGTEVTVSRVADAIGALVMQRYRSVAEDRYIPPGRVENIEHIVLLRDARRLQEMHARFPHARMYLWLHDRVLPGSKHGRRLAAQAPLIRTLPLTIVCVSDWQRRGAEGVLKRMPGCEHVRVHTIYNAIEDTLRPNEAAVDRSKLVFFSSPNKGLLYTLDVFRALRQRMPDLHLHVGNPGYKELPRINVEGVEWLGALPNANILAEVRTALCVLHLNFVLAETFGLVFAEANAVGTPVLTHDCGAAHEVIADSRQILPVSPAQQAYERAARALPLSWRGASARYAAKLGIFEPYIEHIQAWRDGARPRTGPDDRFRFSSIVERWRALFADELDEDEHAISPLLASRAYQPETARPGPELGRHRQVY
jgi:glycosyltransferase involved in cell wall biosynthesis